MKEKVVALLPMKGHSERVPNKNLKDFCGKPLYHAILRKILKCSLINEVFINTDSEDIKSDVKKCFPEVNLIDRPKNIQGDHVSMNKIIEYDLSQIDGDHFLQTHSTNPLITVNTLESAIKYFMKKKMEFDSVFSVTKWQTRLYWEDGSPINHNPEELIRTQDLTPVYEENSNFFLFSKKSFERAGNRRIGKEPAMFEVNKLEAIDIDEPEDFKIAKILYENFN